MEQNFDAAVGDISITQDRSLYVDFTVPYGDLSMVVPIDNERERNAWIFLKPLTSNLWLVSGTFLIFTVETEDHEQKPEDRMTGIQEETKKRR
ncbi:Glutamate receptor 1.2 [Dendrobium catenatum]|uniref:Glutamate receptor 1.2 n=1 Tax=Dendrobium catenatum TaxID=906689 RepID=A0A2I0VGA1_9ASPA|nr:Glutamate receptor 1.2 [Dendrobium catenatum]